MGFPDEKYIGLLANNGLHELGMSGCETIGVLRHYHAVTLESLLWLTHSSPIARQAFTNRRNFSVGSVETKRSRIDLKVEATFYRPYEARKSLISVR